MKTIQLQTLTISNFKGCAALTLDFDGRGATLYGDNAAGKTTVYDALTWLLFGKDSRGRGDFEIKPLDADGKVRDHGAVTAVEGVLSVDGATVTLKRTYFERWATKRGSSEAKFDGNTSEYCVDGVPVKKFEYEARVGDMVSEELFRTLTNVTWFCEGLDWRSRRGLLLDICGVPGDMEILEAEPERFAELSDAVGKLSVEDHKKKLLARRKALNGARDTIPARLDEQKKSVETLSGIDFKALRAERETKTVRVDQLTGELVKLKHGALLDGKRNELASVRNELAALENENERHRQSQYVPTEDRRPVLNADIRRAKDRLARSERLAESEQAAIDKAAKRIDSLRSSWLAVDGETFTAAKCPTCGQVLPQAAQETARGRFEADKERRKTQITDDAGREKENTTAAEQRRDAYRSEADEARRTVERLTDELNNCALPTVPEIRDMPEYAQRRAELEGRIAALGKDVAGLQGENAAIREEISGKVSVLRGEIVELDRQLAREEYLVLAHQREKELREEAQKTAAELEAIDKQLYLCEDFTRFKVRYIEESVNHGFRIARFKLFDEQVNGGLADCCEATFQGVPYGSLNNGARVNLGIDVIRTISEHYGLRVPLFVDNAESVTSLIDAGTQVIRLSVSAGDMELRCEYED